jgi:hypothetical protein
LKINGEGGRHVKNRFFLDRFSLGYILFCFPTASVLLLLHRPEAQRLGPYHWLAYWLINAFLFIFAWQVVNSGEAHPFFTDNGGRRKVLAATVLPFVLLISNFCFPVLLEGGKPRATVITALFLVLGFAAIATGFIGTRGRTESNWTTEDLDQAVLIQNKSYIMLGGITGAALTFALAESGKNFYSMIFQEPFVLSGSIFVAFALFFTLLVLPFLIVHSMKAVVPSTKSPSGGPTI